MHRALLLTQGRRIRGLWLVLLVAAGTAHAQGGQPPSQVLSQSLPDIVPLLDGVTDKSGPELRNDSNTPLTTAQSQELLLVAVHVFEQIGFQVAAAACIDQFKQRDEREVVVHGGVALHQFVESLKQMLQPQISAYSFVKGVFVEDHERNRKG